ncbi:methylaspartate mutase accessory protein GlmL [Liberiplasma polymorphum]|uniref:methylaspartate mutase accessory protein GlmL n=1 Tax=Liberiplasma polymorphum TaxID=3374570 RepID=UPI003774BFBC
MGAHLLVDFGSTYTKLTVVDLEKETLIGTSKAMTTVKTNVLDGFDLALEKLHAAYSDMPEITGVSACSSAAGGLKMAAIGLVEELTVEAAKRACLGAGALVNVVFSHHLSRKEIKQLKSADIDIILLAGGTDGGNKECIIHNAKKLKDAKLDVPIIVAGNKDAADEIEEIFEDSDQEYYICDNVMPKLKQLDVKDAKKIIRQIFITKIIEAKGIKKAEEKTGEIIMPTPEAVLLAAELLAKGFEDVEGYGELMVIDVGGATTDVHTIGEGFPKRSEVIFKGLQEPFAKRTVEGDLGMRYSANALLSLVSPYEFKQYYQYDCDIEIAAKKRHDNVDYLPDTDEEREFDKALARICCDFSMSRHVGHVEVVYTPLGNMYYQTGKDLTDTKYVIGTGGVLINNDDAKEILKEVNHKADKKLELRPADPIFLIDRKYILSAMGLLSQKYPRLALKLMKEHLE